MVKLNFISSSNLSNKKGRKPKINNIDLESHKKGIPIIKSTCCICKKNKSDAYHHVIPRSIGGSEFYSNLIQLCTKCHNEVEYFCSNCLFQIQKICDVDKFINCWLLDNIYFNAIKKVDIVEYEHSPRMEFICKKCNKKLIRTSQWDQKAYGIGANWFSMFTCFKCNNIYKLTMNENVKNWVIDNIKVIL